MKNIFSPFGNSSKEIQTNAEKNFVGKSSIVYNITEIGFFIPDIVPISDESAAAYLEGIDQMLSDPSYQQFIINSIISNIDNFWKYKMLGESWKTTKEQALKNATAHVDTAFEKLGIDVYEYFIIDINGSNTKTSPTLLGKITGSQIKRCSSYQDFLSLATQIVTNKIDEDMAPLIDSDNTKIENDIMLLKMLLKKYPNYQNTLEEVKQ